MSQAFTRRKFLVNGVGSAGFLFPAAFAWMQDSGKPRPPALDLHLVEEFVRKAHFDLKGTKELLEEHPSLLNASWDWGGGDFEMGIEGAGHVGNKEIAKYLIHKGARMTIFVATMLGRLDIVKPALTAFPNMIHSKGPHGLTLIHHATKGGDEALPVLEYLESIGAS